MLSVSDAVARVTSAIAPLPVERIPLLDAPGRVLAQDAVAGYTLPHWDNSAMESFFSSLKTERLSRTVYRTRDEARVDTFDYIERFYNLRRRHSTIGILSPVDFEAKAAAV